MIKSQKYSVRNFTLGNKNLEVFSLYGIVFSLSFFLVSLVYFSMYYFFNSNIKYIFFSMFFILIFSFLNMIYIYFFRLKKIKEEDINIAFPNFIYEGEEVILDLNPNKKNSDVFLRFNIDKFKNIKKEDVEELRALNNSNHPKWNVYWNYGGGLGYNMFDVSPIDVEQITLDNNKMKLFAKKRGVVTIKDFKFYSFDIFGLFKIYRTLKVKDIKIKVLPTIKNRKTTNITSIKNFSNILGNIVSPNIIGVKKAKHGDSIKNTHWKIFAKKEEHWVFIKEKLNTNPFVIWIDTSKFEVKDKSEQYENMLSDVCEVILDKTVDEIILNNTIIKNNSNNKDQIISSIISLNYDENNEIDINVLNNSEIKNILFLSVNNTNEEYYKNIFKKIKSKNIDIKVLNYE